MSTPGEAPYIIRWRSAWEAVPPVCPVCKRPTCTAAMPPMRRLILLRLSLSADVDGYVRGHWPSTRTLASRCGTSRGTVESHLRAAAEAGWIEPKRASRRAPTTYDLHIVQPECNGASGPTADPLTPSGLTADPLSGATDAFGVAQPLSLEGSLAGKSVEREELSRAREGGCAREDGGGDATTAPPELVTVPEGASDVWEGEL